MAQDSAPRAPSELPLYRDLVDGAFVRQEYIRADARDSYRHWWEQQTRWLWYSYGYREHEPSTQEQIGRLYPHLAPPRRRRRWGSRYRYSRSNDSRPLVEHTVVLPDGEELTYQWRHGHGGHWRGDRPFRRGHDRGVSGPGRAPDSHDRSYKTEEFRRANAKTPTRWPFSCGAKRCAQVSDNRADRRLARQLIQQGRYGEVKTRRDPYDTWQWD